MASISGTRQVALKLATRDGADAKSRLRKDQRVDELRRAYREDILRNKRVLHGGIPLPLGTSTVINEHTTPAQYIEWAMKGMIPTLVGWACNEENKDAKEALFRMVRSCDYEENAAIADTKIRRPVDLSIALQFFVVRFVPVVTPSELLLSVLQCVEIIIRRSSEIAHKLLLQTVDWLGECLSMKTHPGSMLYIKLEALSSIIERSRPCRTETEAHVDVLVRMIRRHVIKHARYVVMTSDEELNLPRVPLAAVDTMTGVPITTTYVVDHIYSKKMRRAALNLLGGITASSTTAVSSAALDMDLLVVLFTQPQYQELKELVWWLISNYAFDGTENIQRLVTIGFLVPRYVDMMLNGARSDLRVHVIQALYAVAKVGTAEQINHVLQLGSRDANVMISVLAAMKDSMKDITFIHQCLLFISSCLLRLGVFKPAPGMVSRMTLTRALVEYGLYHILGDLSMTHVDVHLLGTIKMTGMTLREGAYHVEAEEEEEEGYTSFDVDDELFRGVEHASFSVLPRPPVPVVMVATLAAPVAASSSSSVMSLTSSTAALSAMMKISHD
jgi:hypothetical protein